MLKLAKWDAERAVEELAARGEMISRGVRSQDELYRVLSLTVGIVRVWEHRLSEREYQRREEELMAKLENKSGRRSGLEHYLLRAAFGSDPGRRKIVTAWAQACVNVADYMRRSDIVFGDKNVRQVFKEFGVQRARMNNFKKAKKKIAERNAAEDDGWQ